LKKTRHPIAQMLLIGLIVSLAGIALVLAIDWFPPVASTAAKDIDHQWDILLVVSVPIFVLVMTIAIYSVWRFRAKPGDKGDGAPIHGHTGLEVIWVAIPFVIVSVLAVYGAVVLADIERPAPGAMPVEVTGQQFTWSFAYPDAPAGEVTSSELVLPVGVQADFQIKALDVIHSFWVPAFRMKQDAVPGITTNTKATPREEGDFEVVCAELCGIGHSTMRQAVRVVSQDEFDAWLEERAQGGAAAGAESGAEQADAGAQVFQAEGCGGCHEFGPAGSSGTTGPSLDDLAAIAEENGMQPEDFVEESIVDPDAIVEKGYPEGTMPPNYGDTLTPEEIDALIAYLLGSGGGESSSKSKEAS
jgi:cytochrome c oxidase subunit II